MADDKQDQGDLPEDPWAGIEANVEGGGSGVDFGELDLDIGGDEAGLPADPPADDPENDSGPLPPVAVASEPFSSPPAAVEPSSPELPVPELPAEDADAAPAEADDPFGFGDFGPAEGVFDEIAEDEPPADASAASSSAIQIGTGQSGIVPDEWSLAGDDENEPAEAAISAAEAASEPHAGDAGSLPPLNDSLSEPVPDDFDVSNWLGEDGDDGGAIGAVPGEVPGGDDGLAGGDESEQVSEFPGFSELVDATGSVDLSGETSQEADGLEWGSDEMPWSNAGDEAAADNEGDIGLADFEGGFEPDAPEPSGVPLEGVDEAAAVGAAAVATGAETPTDTKADGREKKAKPPKPRRKKGGIGAMIAVMMGGVLSIPIVLAILLWGFGRDDFNLRQYVPENLAFILPAKFRPGGGASPLDRLPDAGSMPGLDDVAASSPDAADPLDDAAAADNGADAAVAADNGSPWDAPPGGGAMPDPQPEPEPEPLDLSGITAAAERAAESLDAVLALPKDAEIADRKKAWFAWYMSLAGLGEEAVMLDQAAADSAVAREVPPPLAEAVGRIAAEESVHDTLATLAGLWMRTKNRKADGVVLPAEIGPTRKLGPWWSTSVRRMNAKPDEAEIVVLTRDEPAAGLGEEVLVVGVVAGGDVIWAAGCLPLEAQPAPAIETADDLFSLP